MHDYQKLRVWEKACDLAVGVYQATARFPTAERFGYTSQMRRASLSIASNIAEGAGRASRQDFARYVRIAIGSACELETQVLIARRIPELAPYVATDLLPEILSLKRMLHRLEVSLKPRIA